MKIAYVHSFYSSTQPSGENFAVDAEVRALRRAGHEVELFAARTDDLEGDGLYAVRAAYRVATGRGANPLDAIRRFFPDVIHIHNVFPNLGRQWVEKIDAPIVHTVHNFRPLCANGLLFRDGRVCTDCPDGKRWSGIRQACYRGSSLATIPGAWANRNGPMADPLFRRADRLIMLSERQRQIYTRAGVPPDKMFVSPNFLPDELDPGPPDNQDRQGWLFVGRLGEEKGIIRLLDHWPKEEVLRVIGDGPLRPEVEARAARAEHVHVLGARTREEVLISMRLSRGLVFPSLSYETFGLVCLEALATGTPVIAFKPTTIADRVEQDGTGAVADWEENLTSVIARTPEPSRAFQAHTRRLFRAMYSERAWLARVSRLYSATIGLSSEPGPHKNLGGSP